jgi:hypothetical protein
MAAAAVDPARIAFEDALGRIGFATVEHNAFILESGCTNIAMLGILPSEHIRQICKHLRTRAVDHIPITAIQEQLVQAMRFWVAGLQRLQQIVDPTQFTTVIALNQAQVMRQTLEDDARAEKEAVAKAPDKVKNANNWKCVWACRGRQPAQAMYVSRSVKFGIFSMWLVWSRTVSVHICSVILIYYCIKNEHILTFTVFL